MGGRQTGTAGTTAGRDGYASHGSDERDMAYEYYERLGYPYWNK